MLRASTHAGLTLALVDIIQTVAVNFVDAQNGALWENKYAGENAFNNFYRILNFLCKSINKLLFNMFLFF